MSAGRAPVVGKNPRSSMAVSRGGGFWGKGENTGGLNMNVEIVEVRARLKDIFERFNLLGGYL